MPERFTHPYLDAVSWISALEGEGEYVEDLREVLAAADRGELVIVVSALMPLEVLGGGRQVRTDASAERALRALSRSNVLQVQVNPRVVLDARALRIEHGLDSVDALHLASAAAGRADAFLTNDAAILRVGSHRGVPIVKPVWPGDLPMFSVGDDD